jgi:hypothetical protein
MADIDAARSAIEQVVAFMDGLDDDTRRRIPDTTVGALIHDLDVAFYSRLTDGRLGEVTEIDPVDLATARLRLTLHSGTLIDVVEGRLSFARGWARGLIKVDARLRDIFELRRFL